MLLRVLLIAGLFLNAYGQIKKNAPTDNLPRIQNNDLGISFAQLGLVKLINDSTYNITFTSHDVLSPKAVAEISTTNRLFVSLPGSYGGRLYLDSPNEIKIFKNRILLDSVNTGNKTFQRSYWAVYAGMGMWDCVINCHVKQNEKYYVVSLVQEKHLGKPGEIVDGKAITTKELQSKALSALRDTNNDIISKFNKLLSTVQIFK
jgi:hypothetical protein